MKHAGIRIGSVMAGLQAMVGGIALAGPVNVNTADAETLARELNGVGQVVAEAIVQDREQNGRFESPDELMRVSGIGQRILERNRDFILIDSAPASN